VHELSIADAVVRIATSHAAGRRVTRVELRVGELRQVVRSSLEFSFDLVARDTPVEGAELAVEAVPASGRCRACGRETALPGFPLRCSLCGEMDVEVLRGEELLVDSLEFDDALVRSGGMPYGG
jgi:hydrogenase nickel incorporation protein HypA/HybF